MLYNISGKGGVLGWSVHEDEVRKGFKCGVAQLLGHVPCKQRRLRPF
jgi:hypothetical protein